MSLGILRTDCSGKIRLGHSSQPKQNPTWSDVSTLLPRKFQGSEGVFNAFFTPCFQWANTLTVKRATCQQHNSKQLAAIIVVFLLSCRISCQWKLFMSFPFSIDIYRGYTGDVSVEERWIPFFPGQLHVHMEPITRLCTSLLAKFKVYNSYVIFSGG